MLTTIFSSVAASAPKALFRVLWVMLTVGVLAGCATRTFYELPPDTPEPLEPLKSVVLANGTSVNFIWQAASDVEHYDFHVFNRINGDTQRYARSDLSASDVCEGGMCSISMTLSMPVDSGHAWRVRAFNNAGYSGWSRSLFEIR